MVILQFVIATVFLGMTGILLSNWWTFPRLGESETRRGDAATNCAADPGIVSFLVPARDEATVIADTVSCLLAQPEATEVLVLDDHSTDGTADAAYTANPDPRLRVIQGAGLPPGWLGKNWACHQLANQARRTSIHDWLIFTDADVRWQSGALAALIDQIKIADADLITVWPTQRTVTWGERLVVPLMALVIHAYLPVLLVHRSASPLFAAANGQCIALRRSAYERIGGHASVRDNVLEDVALARRAKAAGLRLRMVEGNKLINCRMYHSWREVNNGYAKNILKGYGNSLGLLAATLFHAIVFLVPWILLLFGPKTAIPLWPWGPFTLALWGVGLRAATAHRSQQRIGDALLLPISVLLMSRIAAQALWWQWRHGGPVWKGRVVKNEQ